MSSVMSLINSPFLASLTPVRMSMLSCMRCRHSLEKRRSCAQKNSYCSETFFVAIFLRCKNSFSKACSQNAYGGNPEKREDPEAWNRIKTKNYLTKRGLDQNDGQNAVIMNTNTTHTHIYIFTYIFTHIYIYTYIFTYTYKYDTWQFFEHAVH